MWFELVWNANSVLFEMHTRQRNNDLDFFYNCLFVSYTECGHNNNN